MSRRRLRDLAAVAALAALSAAYLVEGRRQIVRVVSEPRSAHKLVASDSEHYLEIADAFARGDWSLSYVAPTGGPDKAHRQPLYPALLAFVSVLTGRDLAALATVNLALVVAAMWLAYAIGTRLFASRLAGLAAAAVLYRVPFLWTNATERLLTEPSYVLIVLAMGYAFLGYRASGSGRWLLALAAAGGLAYLCRTNGLFVTAAALSVAAGADALARARSMGGGDWLSPVPRRWLLAALVLVVVSAPSWVPRAWHAGDPLYHGYLSNYLWVDTYEEGHVPGPPRYGFRDYASTHGLSDALARARYGLHRAFYSAPREKYGDLVAAAMLASLLVVIARRDGRVLAWMLVGGLQMLPLAWTALANPARRLPATALLPFGVVVVAAAVAHCVRIVEARRDAAGNTREQRAGRRRHEHREH